jgi:hypothetical protein
MQTHPAVLKWLSRAEPNPLAWGLNMSTRPPVFRDPDVEVYVLRAIMVRGAVQEIGSRVTMASSDAAGLAATIPATVEYCK